VGSSNLIKRVYFPRLVIPISGICSGLPDFLLAFVVLLGMMFYYGLYPSWSALLWLPLFLLLALVTALGAGLWLSALNVEYRDVRHVVPFLIQAWLFLTPIAYPSSLLSERWHVFYGLNPMVGVVEGFRWTLLGSGHPPDTMVMVSALAALAILISGLFYFRRMERSFADVV
jgi:lipopolysaccharide transport system permease protein